MCLSAVPKPPLLPPPCPHCGCIVHCARGPEPGLAWHCMRKHMPVTHSFFVCPGRPAWPARPTKISSPPLLHPCLKWHTLPVLALHSLLLWHCQKAPPLFWPCPCRPSVIAPPPPCFGPALAAPLSRSRSLSLSLSLPLLNLGQVHDDGHCFRGGQCFIQHLRHCCQHRQCHSVLKG